MGQEAKRMKMKKGMVSVLVGKEESQEEKFVIPITHLHHKLFKNLLETSRDVYGYSSSGPLRLPCSVSEFMNVRFLIEHELVHQHKGGSHSSHHQVHNTDYLSSFS